MKVKTVGLWTAAALLAVSVAGCSSGNSNTAGGNTEKLKAEISKLQEENKQLKEENDKLKQQPSAAPVTAAGNEEAEGSSNEGDSANGAGSEEQGKAIVKGQPLTIDGIAEYTITKTSFAKKIIPSKPGSFYTYYEAKEQGTTYLAITLKVKNLAGEGKQADSFAEMQVKYDNQYEYSTFSTLEKNGGEDFTYSNIYDIEPLKNGTLVYLAEVPDEVKTSDKPLYADVKIEGQTYRYTIRK